MIKLQTPNSKLLTKKSLLFTLLLFTSHLSPLTLSAQADNDSSYWNSRFLQLLRWTYVDTSLSNIYLTPDTITPNSQLLTPNYQRLSWYGYTFQSSDLWPVVFIVALGDGDPQPLTIPALHQLAQWGAFLTNEDHRRLQGERLKVKGEIVDSLDSLYLSPLTSHLSPFFIDSMQAVLLSDSIAFANARRQQDIERTKQRMNRDRIFILNLNTARSEHMFGIQLNLYNCFSKTISMLEFNVAPYNAKGQLQQDSFHRTVRTMRCIGPIPPGAPALYTFDELFWDDGSRIKYMRLNSITFYFTDGTSRSFNGYDNILKHTL